MSYTKLFIVLIAFVCFLNNINVVYAWQPPFEFSHQKMEKKEKVAEDAPASGYNMLNNVGGNVAIGIAGYHDILAAAYFASRGETRELFDKETRDGKGRDMSVYTPFLEEFKTYGFLNLAISPKPFSEEWFAQLKTLRGDCINGDEAEIFIRNANEKIEELLGIQDAIPDLPQDPNAVLLLSLVTQKAFWVNQAVEEKMEWEDTSRVPSIITKARVVTTRAKNGVKVFHIYMKDDTILSLCFKDEQREIGSWLPNSLHEGERISDEEMLVQIPTFTLKSEWNFKDQEALKFLFSPSAELRFGETEPLMLHSFGQKLSFSLNRNGIQAKAVTFAYAVTRGFRRILESNLKFNKSFMGTLSFFTTNGGEPLMIPTFAFMVEKPQDDEEE